MTITERLVAAGMNDEVARSKEELFASADHAHATLAGKGSDVQRFWVPGRIEVLGKHTDYAGGRSLLCAVERGFCVTASPRSDSTVNILDALGGERVAACTASGAVTTSHSGSAHWSNYVETVVRRLAHNFAPLQGADIAFTSDLPIAAGVSSSSAMVTALFLAIAGANGLREDERFRAAIPDEDALAGYLGALENGYPFGTLAGERGVGTFGGSEDHTAILRGRVGSVVQYRFCPVAFEQRVPVPTDHSFLIASSGVRAEKTGNALAAYNRLSQLSSAALERWNQLTGRSDRTLGEAVALRGEEVADLLQADSPELAERTSQFRAESEVIIPASARALEAGDIKEFGALVARSMDNAQRMLHNQVAETIFLTERARALGAVASSAFGAGFGGSVWALAASDRVHELCERLKNEYGARFPERSAAAEFFVTRAGPAALEV